MVYFNTSDEINVLWRASRALEKQIGRLKEQRGRYRKERVTGAYESSIEIRGQKRALSPGDEQPRISKELHPDTASPSNPKRCSPSHESPIPPEPPSSISTSGPLPTPVSSSFSLPNLLPLISTNGPLPTPVSSSFSLSNLLPLFPLVDLSLPLCPPVSVCQIYCPLFPPVDLSLPLPLCPLVLVAQIYCPLFH